MATRTKPLVTAATLASAAAIAVASPAIAPAINLPSPHALSAAKVQLATFADVLSVPAVEWTDVLFGNTTWGNVLSPTNYGADYAQPQDVSGQAGYVNPWANFCDGNCNRSGFTGVQYLFFDALINGNGQGYDNVSKWNTGIVNYFFEPNSAFPIGDGGGSSVFLQFNSEGVSAATWYALQGAIGKSSPALTKLLASAYWGPQNVPVFYTLGLTITAALLQQVPGVGALASNTITAYLGNLEIPNSGGSYYQIGLSGALNYLVDIATGAVPFPAASTRAGAATLAAAATPAAPAAAATTVAAPETPAVSNDTKSAADAPESAPASKAPESTPAADVSDNTPATDAPESTPAADAPESTPAADTKAAETPAVSVPESTPAATDTKPADTGRPGPAKTAPKHPVRDAVEKVTKQINSAINGAKAAKADKADSAS